MATFARHRSRLAVVREQKAKARLDMLGEEEMECLEPRKRMKMFVCVRTIKANAQAKDGVSGWEPLPHSFH